MNKSVQRKVILTARATNEMENPPTRTTSTQSSVLTWTDVRAGTGVPAYRDKIASLQDASSSYVRSDVVNFNPGNFNALVVWDGSTALVKNIRKEAYRGNTMITSLPPAPVGTYATVDSQALSQFYNDCSAALSPFKGGVLAGELKETLGMIRRPASSLRDGFAKYLNRAYRAKQRHGRRAIKEIANLYMEGTFGWMPLLASIRGAVDAYKNLMHEFETARAFGKASDRGTKSFTTTNLTALNAIKVIVQAANFTTWSAVYKGVVKAQLDGIRGENASRVAYLSGFDLRDFAPTLWELMPLSWAADYFANISGILNSPHALTSEWVWRSRAITGRVSYEASASLDVAYAKQQLGSKYRFHTFSASNAKWLRTTYERSFPQLGLPTVTFGIPNSPWKWANLLGLMTQRINSSK